MTNKQVALILAVLVWALSRVNSYNESIDSHSVMENYRWLLGVLEH